MNARVFLITFTVALSTNLATCEQFLYFAYGSNLLAQRIHLNSPSAVLEGIGELADHRLDFTNFTSFWNGTVATIIEEPGEKVWGALWALDIEHMKSLDRQESVPSGGYFPKTVNITKSDGNVVQARTYVQTTEPPKISSGEKFPYDRRPSRTYLNVIIEGAIECGLPEDYIKKLKNIPSNDKEGYKALDSLDSGHQIFD